MGRPQKYGLPTMAIKVPVELKETIMSICLNYGKLDVDDRKMYIDILNNSEATVETPSVNDNEQKGKICNAPEDDGCYCKELDIGCMQCKFYH